MKKILLLAALVLALPIVSRAQSADDQYLKIYTLIQDADALSTNQPAQALTKYREAYADLVRFHRINPDWNRGVVNFRLNYLNARITIVSAKVPTNAPAATMPSKTNAPAAQAPSIQAPPSAGTQSQIEALQQQLNRLQADNQDLAAKLREALAARPAALEPGELAKAQEKIRTLEKSNELLQADLSGLKARAASPSGKANQQLEHQLAEARQALAEQSDRAVKLATENDLLKKLAASKSAPPSADALAEARKEIAALKADKELWAQEKLALQNRIQELSAAQSRATAAPDAARDSTRVARLERERDQLQKSLDAARRELRARPGAAEDGALQEQLVELQTRVAVYEAQAVPYSPQELALLKEPEPALPAAAPKRAKEAPSALSPAATALVVEAQRDFVRHDYAGAEKKYLEVVRQDDKNVATLANLATVEVQMNRLNAAEKYLHSALALDPNDAYSLCVLGNLEYRRGRTDKALDALGRAAKLDPQNAEIQNFLGLALMQKGLRKQAETALRKAIELQPDYGSAHNNLAVMYASEQPPAIELARWHYQKALAAGFPRNPQLEKILEDKQTADAAR